MLDRGDVHADINVRMLLLLPQMRAVENAESSSNLVVVAIFRLVKVEAEIELSRETETVQCIYCLCGFDLPSEWSQVDKLYSRFS